MVTKALLEVSIEGLGEFGRTSIFPCGIFQCMKGVNREPGTPNYDLFRLALKSTAQRIYPNYCNCDTSMNNLEIDKKSKEDYINSLSKNNKDKLISIIEQHPELGQILNLEVVDE